MARNKHIDTNPKFLAVDLAAQLLPGTFEHALDHLLTAAIDLSSFDARYKNDTTGAPAYPPKTLLQVVLFAYSRGIVSSRAIALACEEHVTFIALCGDTRPHFTTIAYFVSSLGADIAPIFAAVLSVCDSQGLIGREMFAIDGVKLPSNASKQRSGTRTDFERQATKLEAAATTMLERHRANDTAEVEPTDATLDGTRKEIFVALSTVPLLIIDDLGMRKLPPTAAEDLLELIMRRYERASTILTSNRPVDDWGKLLGDTAAVTAMLDRLLHHAYVLTCGPRSWRTKLHTATDSPVPAFR